ncbi:MAG TPA: haloalkane dehalogenase [Phototrophicaceae bacterium]|nr:haloalkane dehalogenase [Phototrophicaceae bacterium]
MPVIRTPDERFDHLPDFPYPPQYIEIDGLRMHYIEAGSGDPILCLHGEPTRSFLYRKMIPPLAKVGRVIAPDLIGFGRSDKYTELEEYSYRMHHNALTGFIITLDLQRITLVCQDWGGVLGLPIVMDMPERFARLVIMNTGLPGGDVRMQDGFMQWRDFATRTGRDLEPGQLVKISSVNQDAITSEIQAAYDAPFPDAAYRAGVAAFPLLIPLQLDDAGAAEIRLAREKLASWDKPALVMFSDSDPVTRGGDRFFRKLIPTAKEQITIEGAGHFLQEEKGEIIAEKIVDFIRQTP